MAGTQGGGKAESHINGQGVGKLEQGQRGDRSMIRIDRHQEVDGARARRPTRGHGVWEYSCPEYPLVCGVSRQPLFDDCRQLEAIYGVTVVAWGCSGRVTR